MNRIALLCCLALTALSPQAEIYKWVDERGKVHFSDKKPEQADSQALELRINTYENVTVFDAPALAEDKVILYSTSWCGYCKKAKQYLQQNQIAFVEYDIEKDPAAKRAYDALGATGVPVILVGDKRMNGFSEARFKELYGTSDSASKHRP